MTVKELIETLQQFDPETRIFTSITDTTDYCLTLELDHQTINLEDELSGDNVCDDYEDDFNEEFDYTGKPVLIITLDC
jgi:hypothetical protein